MPLRYQAFNHQPNPPPRVPQPTQRNARFQRVRLLRYRVLCHRPSRHHPALLRTCRWKRYGVALVLGRGRGVRTRVECLGEVRRGIVGFVVTVGQGEDGVDFKRNK